MPVQNLQRNRERRLQRLLMRVVTRIISQFLSVYLTEIYHGRNQHRANLMHWRTRRFEATSDEDENDAQIDGEEEQEEEEDEEAMSSNSSAENESINSRRDTARIYRSLRGNNFQVPNQRTLRQAPHPPALIHQPVAGRQDQEQRHDQNNIQPTVIPLNQIGFDEVDGAAL